MAPRANWKGFLRLSLVTCPIALFPATSESEKISFNQINKRTGHPIRYLKVDAETGEEVSSDDIIKGYQVDRDRYLEITTDELENIALESTRTIEIDEFVPRSEIDDLYLVRPYYIVPDGKVGHDAYVPVAADASIIDEHIKGWEVFLYMARKRCDLFRVRDIVFDRVNSRMSFFHLVKESLSASCDNHFIAKIGETNGECETDAVRPSGNQDGAIGKLHLLALFDG
jgi:non-homologous end joining protein Ku